MVLLIWLAVMSVIGAFAQVIVCLWFHDTNALGAWVHSMFGWFAAVCAMISVFNRDNKL
jgi:hypothetical protein